MVNLFYKRIAWLEASDDCITFTCLEAKESVKETGSKIADKGHGKLSFWSFFFTFSLIGHWHCYFLQFQRLKKQ